MDTKSFQEKLTQAAQHLKRHDPILAPLIELYGVAGFLPHTNYYQALVDSIIGQQLSVKAARSIRARFYALFQETDTPSPEEILTKTVEELRAVGFSNAKARYVRDLAEHVIDGRLKLGRFDELSNEEIISELTSVKGVGEWTAHMFMMFTLGRLDILPVGDLGIKNGVKKVYGLDELPDADKIREIALKNNWHPYESIASWYMWESLDNAPK